MADTTQTPAMNLVVPTVGVDPGPDYANNINADLAIIDGHNHTPGYGVQVPTAGLNINADLTFQNNNGTNFRSVRFQPQPSALALASDLGCLYEYGVDLYYNDGNGNQIRITSAGGIAGTPGSISGLVSPASASYSPGSATFIWQSNTNTPANMDFASAILRNLTANSHGLTLNPPAAMASDFSITLPTLPVSTSILQMDSSGNMYANLQADGTTIVNSGTVLSVGTIPPGSVANQMFTMDFELNGNYSNLSTPSTQLDGLRFFNFNATIINAWAWIRGAGASGTTNVDIKYVSAPGGSFASIFSTTPKFTSTSPAAAYVDSTGTVSPPTGTTAGVLSTTSVVAGGALRFDLLGAMVGPTDSVGITVVYKQR